MGCWGAYARQVAPLDRIVSVKLTNERLADVLTAIGQKATITFSYSAGLFDPDRRIDLVAINKPVRQILDQLFRGSLRYKVRQNYVILQKGDPEPQHLFISGYIIDKQTNAFLGQASVFDRITLASAVTNPSGYFRLKLPAKSTSAVLQISKQNYLSETMTVKSRHEEPLSIALTPLPPQVTIEPVATTTPKEVEVTKPEPQEVVITPPSVDTTTTLRRNRKQFDLEKVKKWLLSAKQFVHDQNVQDTLHRTAQFSILPFVGTNHLLSGQVINDFSFNLIAGYSRGVNAFEAGGFANLVLEHVSGVQVSGAVNLVGGRLDGLQFAGFSNHVFGKSHGYQFAGAVNTYWTDASGAQFAGFANFNVQNFSGLQVAGTANVTLGKKHGWQVAGLMNIANELEGVQIAPLNIAQKVRKGRQLGVVNFADSSAKAPIGLFSYVRKNGYRRLEIGYNELTQANLTFKTGMRRFYNIFTGGVTPQDSLKNWVWSYGYGIGTALKLDRRERSLLNLDATFNLLSVGQVPQFNQHTRFQLSFEQRLGSKLTLALGPSFNMLATRPESAAYLQVSKKIIHAVLFDEPFFTNWNVKGWVGYQVGIRWVL